MNDFSPSKGQSGAGVGRGVVLKQLLGQSAERREEALEYVERLKEYRSRLSYAGIADANLSSQQDTDRLERLFAGYPAE